MLRYFTRISFKGTRYAGWQIQDNAITVQEILNKALEILLKHEVVSIGCGRTDTGVHAKQFYVHFDSQNELKDINKFIYSLNAILPDDIVVQELVKVNSNAHARFDATMRTYEYFISSSKTPFLRDFVMVNYSPLDIEKMNRVCSFLVGKNDFSSFSKTHTQVKTNICTITEAQWEVKRDLLVFTVSSDRFLRGMVRAIVGTSIDAGTGKMEPENILSILEKRDRSEAGVSVPACGLYLSKIQYPYFTNVEPDQFPA